MGGYADKAKERDKEYQRLRKETVIKDWGQLCLHSWATELIPVTRVTICKHLMKKLF